MKPLNQIKLVLIPDTHSICWSVGKGVFWMAGQDIQYVFSTVLYYFMAEYPALSNWKKKIMEAKVLFNGFAVET